MKPLLTTPDTGMLIAVEGNDGCGKSTQIQLLMDWLREEYPDRKVAYVKCPAMQEGPGIVRRLVLGEPVMGVNATHFMHLTGMPIYAPDPTGEYDIESCYGTVPDGVTARWLYFASWLWTYQTVIVPLLAEDALVVLDRTEFVSNYVYGLGQGVPAHLIERVIAEQFAHTRHPDLAVVLDLPVDVAMARVRERPDTTEKGANYFDLADEHTFQTRRDCYRDLADRWDWVALVDATGTPDEVSARVCATVAAQLYDCAQSKERAALQACAITEAVRLVAGGFIGAVNSPETWDDLRARTSAAVEQAQRELNVTHMTGRILLGPSDTPCLAVSSARGTHLYFPEGVDLVDLFALAAAMAEERKP